MLKKRIAFCTYCGEEIRNDYAFCRFCGENKEVSNAPDRDVYFCMRCVSANHRDIKARYCMFCGYEMREGEILPDSESREQTYPFIHTSPVPDEKDDIYMKYVYGGPKMNPFYASSEVMGSPRSSEMGDVYASPKVMGGRKPWKSETLFTPPKRYCMYCGNKVRSEDSICLSCERSNEISDPDFTISFCTNCNSVNPANARYCMICGIKMQTGEKLPVSKSREQTYPFIHTSPVPDEIDDIYMTTVYGGPEIDMEMVYGSPEVMGSPRSSEMGAVYASPEMMGKRKKGILKRLFKRKDK